MAEATGIDKESLYDQLADEFGGLYYLFEDVAARGPEALKGLQPEVAAQIALIAKENVKIPYVNITGYVDLTCPQPNGIDVIKRALKAAMKSETDEVSFDVSYIGAPRYRIRTVALDYKTAENAMKKAANAAIAVIIKAGGTGKFHRELQSS